VKMPFKRNTGDEIKRTTEQLSQLAAKLTGLQEKRAGYITENADLATLTLIGDEIASTERLISTLQERLRALDGRLKAERREAIEQRKEAALAALEKSLRAEADAAIAVVKSLVDMANTYGRYKQVRSQPRPWSALLHNKHDLPVGINLLGDICSSFYWSPMQEHGITELPGRAPELIERLRGSVDRTIASLRAEPIPRSALFETETEDEAVAS
jgi:uncharacterized coiled-coil protein SlyX